MSQFADAEQRESAVRADDDGRPFVHACYCGKWGFFGYVMLMKGRTGTWFCAEHRPAEEPVPEPLGSAPILIASSLIEAKGGTTHVSSRRAT